MATATSKKRFKRKSQKDQKTNVIQEFPTTILLKVTGQVTETFDGEPYSDEQYELENDILDGHFSDLLGVSLEDAYSDDDELTVVGSGWVYVDCTLPFACTARLAPAEIEYALESAFDKANDVLWSPTYDFSVDTYEEAWVMDRKRATISLTDLLEVHRQAISRQKFQAICKRPEKHIPREVLKAR